MNTPTFKEQFDKITTAYFNDTLRPLDSCACFIGNMFNNDGTWQWVRDWDVSNSDRVRWIGIKNELTPGMFKVGNKFITTFTKRFYSWKDIIKMESNFLTIWENGLRTEQSLFDAMDSTLDMLRKLHEDKGEIIESYEFKQRNHESVLHKG